MRIAYFDCFSGAAGDMILAALVHAGLPVDELHTLIEKLNLPGVRIEYEAVKRHGIAAGHVRVVFPRAEGHAHRHLPKIRRIIESAGLPEPVTRNALAVFQRLAEAEALVHETTVDKVHFHEVGADDAIVDIVGACYGLHALGVERVISSPIPTGSGTVTCDHGVMPVPAPATAQLLRGVPILACDEPGELTTPTGAAILGTLADEFSTLPSMRISAVGYGSGTRPGETRPNLLRVILGEAEAAGGTEVDSVVVLETQLDDCPPQNVAFALERTLAAGAVDAFIVPIIMKKGRPGQLLTVLCRPSDAATVEHVLFRETSTLGVRRIACSRTTLPRRMVQVDTHYGAIRVKIASGAVGARAWPEFEDCRAAAERTGAALAEVQRAALAAWANREDDAGRHDPD